MNKTKSRWISATPPYRLRQWLPGVGLALLGTNIHTAPAIAAPTPAGATQPAPLSVTLPPELQAAGKWDSLKTLWRTLALVRPSHPDSKPSDGERYVPVESELIRGRWPTLPGYQQRAYYQALSKQQTEQLQQKLIEIFGDKITSPEARLLFRLTQLRIQEMSQAQRQTGSFDIMEDGMMCRAMPPACMTYRLSPVQPDLYLVNAIDRIALRTRALVTLRDKGAISESVYENAFKTIQQDAKLVLYLDALAGNSAPQPLRWGGRAQIVLLPEDFGGKYANLRLPEIWARAVKAAAARPEAENPAQSPDIPRLNISRQDQVGELLKKLENLRTTYDRLDPLLADLVR